MVEGPVTITLKSAKLIESKIEKGGKNVDPYIKVTIGKTHKWDSKTLRKGGLTPNWNNEAKKF
jgi:Ca2+-dependent lipid-binding protein